MASLLSQQILAIEPAQLRVHAFNSRQQHDAVRSMQALDADFLGIATQLSNSGAVDAIAFATPTVIFHLTLVGTSASQPVRGSPLSTLLFGEGVTLVAFSMARLALQIYRDTGNHVTGIDLSTLLASPTQAVWSPAKFVQNRVDPTTDRFSIHKLWYPAAEDDDLEATRRLCLRAWVSAVCAQYPYSDIRGARKVSTSNVTKNQLACLGRLFRCVDILEAAKPTRVDNEFKEIALDTDPGELTLSNARFKSRVRRSENTKVIMETKDGQQLIGQAVRAEGKQTTVRVMQGRYHGGIERIRVEGREESTFAETARDIFLLRLLRAEVSLRDRPFIQLLWFPPPDLTRENQPQHIELTSAAFSRLNDAQRKVTAAMISSTEPLVIAHGPPGTGKTTTIAAAVDYWFKYNETVWIIAQSNVGVKNIARSFIDKGFLDFKVLVSKEFYVEWHEHLYEKIISNVIRTDDLTAEGGRVAAERIFLDCRIVLCTLSMLSNPALDNTGVFQNLPVRRLVVDEASQIDVSEFMHLFHKFTELEKVCLFGDPKQLGYYINKVTYPVPPYGRDKASDLQSIFEIKHLKARAYFLNTQYRMPIPLGEFISHNVYNKKLHSVHKTCDPSCVVFIDAWKGKEEQVGTSWVNQEEVNVVVSLVRDYYRRQQFCVITPYDPQRSAIQKALEKANLPSEAVYNVDSFQGHEAPFVILSAVRTAKPGFLSLLERMNVMLTRCKEGMVIVTNQTFVRGAAQKTLLGRLAVHWSNQTSVDSTWVDWRQVVAKTVDMPGVSAPKSMPQRPVGVASLSVGRPALAPSSSLSSPKPTTDTPVSRVDQSFRRLEVSTKLSTNQQPALTSSSFPALASTPYRSPIINWPCPRPASIFDSSTTPRYRTPTWSTVSSADRVDQGQPEPTRSTRLATNQADSHPPVDDFPVIGQATKNSLKGRWRNGSDAVKYCG